MKLSVEPFLSWEVVKNFVHLLNHEAMKDEYWTEASLEGDVLWLSADGSCYSKIRKRAPEP